MHKTEEFQGLAGLTCACTCIQLHRSHVYSFAVSRTRSRGEVWSLGWIRVTQPLWRPTYAQQKPSVSARRALLLLVVRFFLFNKDP